MGELEAPEVEIAFFEKNDAGIYPHNDDPMVITVRYDTWEIKRVLID